MTTSGSSDFTMTAREVMTDALRTINAVGQSQAAPADDLAVAQNHLNRMLKTWTIKCPHLGRRVTATLSTVIGQATYTLTERPLTLSTVELATSADTWRPLARMDINRYRELSDVTSTGAPSQYFYDRQRDAGVLSLWQVPSEVQDIRYTGHRRVEDIDDPANGLDIEQEYLETVVYGLASRLADHYATPEPRYSRIAGRAEVLWREMHGHARDGGVIFARSHEGYAF